MGLKLTYEIFSDMKKILLFFIAIVIGANMNAQLVGDGLTPATAYYGTITNAQSWTFAYNNGTIYVGQSGNPDLTITTGGSLTIESGVTVRFCTTASDLIITNNGILTANGTASSNITFTKNDQTTWGHISFQNMTPGFTGQSSINYCIVQFGQKTGSTFNFETAGGGIQTAYSHLTISNSIIRNNTAGWGGGIYVNANASPLISNCIISNNTAETTGGGMSIYQHSAAIVENCIIMKNTSNGGGGGGGIFIGDFPDNVKIYNCTIVSNTSFYFPGNNIRIWQSAPSTGPQFFNTIVWGSVNSILYLGLGPDPTDFNYCAIQGYSKGYTNCINLNATNNNPAGPNFYNIATGLEDYRINFISPCRDAGTSTGVPTTDILGNPRTLPYDIGAYEFISNTWKLTAATTDWTNAANWNGGVPTSTSEVVIPSGATNYPISTPAPDFTLGSGHNMSLGPGAKATLGAFTNNGTLILQSDATSGSASFIVSSYSGNDATLELFLTGGNPGAPTLKLNKWHFISTPVALLPVSTFAPTYTTNVVGWYDNQVSGTLATGWIAYDGYRYSTGGMGGPTFTNLTPGNGYDFFATTDRKYTFSGQLNTGTFVMNLNFTTPPGSSSLNGFNLLGNPFSSGLDWDYILTNTAYPPSTSKALYFTRDNAQCSYINGVGIPSDVTGIIPPMQGFFLKTYSTGNSITLPAEGRVQGGIHARYKGLEIIPLVRLKLVQDALSDETVVRFDEAAKSGLDYDFDAPKMFLSSDVLSIYTTSQGSDFAIDGLPFPDTFIEIPVVVNLTASGSHSITTTQLQGLDNYDITLIDNTTGISTNLKTTPVLNFSASAGTIGNRFVLKVGTITTGIDNPIVSNNTFNIYPANDMINIRTVSDEWDGKSGSIRVIDLTGRNAGYIDNAEFSKNSLIQVAAPVTKGIYIVEIKSGLLRYVGKVIIK